MERRFRSTLSARALDKFAGPELPQLGAIIDHSKEEFKAHPEYLGLVTVDVTPDAPAARKLRRSI